MVENTVHHNSSVALKISLYRSLFRGREDVYPRRFESRKTGKSGSTSQLAPTSGCRGCAISVPSSAPLARTGVCSRSRMR